MLRCTSIVLVVAAFTVSPLAAQTPWRYKWEKGQTYTYKTQHVTNVSEQLEKTKTESSSRLTLVKRWLVTDVDSQGNATLEMSLLSMRNEQTRPNGEVLLFDSEDVDKSTPALKGMAKFIGRPLHAVKLNPQGQAIEAKEDIRAKFDAEPPFVVVTAGAAPQEGQSWSRPFEIADPNGSDSKIQFVQKFLCGKSTPDGKANLQVTTVLKSELKNASERIPLLQREVEGKAVFDVERGITLTVELAVDRKVEEHQGKGSSYRYASTFVEQLIPNTDPKVIPAGNP